MEEALKAVWVVVLLRRGRVGFLVDAGVLGFAVGAGFALVENVEYLTALDEPRVLLWLARGLGTAILHGATTAVFAMLAKALADRHPGRPMLTLVPGLLVAIAAHSLYNHFLVSPLLAASLLLVGLPLLVVAVFERSERATRDWLGVGLDTDLEVVEAIVSGRALETRHRRVPALARRALPRRGPRRDAVPPPHPQSARKVNHPAAACETRGAKFLTPRRLTEGLFIKLRKIFQGSGPFSQGEK